MEKESELGKLNNGLYGIQSSGCKESVRAVKDAMDVLGGKWKVQIIMTLLFGDKRFKEIAKNIPGITDKMLSKELKDLEMNLLVNRTVYESFPPKVEYSITEHGKTLHEVIQLLRQWGIAHRVKIIQEK